MWRSKYLLQPCFPQDMASSNRHWPSMFKSKTPANSTQHLSSGQRSTSIPGCEERSPEPKPRWNPRPEQIRILESIFNSGMVNPPREEIRKIRAQLQEYGQLGDANVFYWFQNRKSRSKHKHRQPKSHTQQQIPSPPPPPAATRILTVPASSSSSSDKSSLSNLNMRHPSLGSSVLLNSPTDPVNMPFFSSELFFSPVPAISGEFVSAASTQGFCFPELQDQSTGNCSGADLYSDLIVMEYQRNEKMIWNHDQDFKLDHSFPIVTSSTSDYILQGGPLNVCESFGDGVVLSESNGQPVVTNECGIITSSSSNLVVSIGPLFHSMDLEEIIKLS